MAALRVLLSLCAVLGLCVAMIGACSKEAGYAGDAAQGGSGAGGGAATGGQGGAGDECVVDADCPGEDSECAQRRCSNGFCSVEFQPAGHEVGLQVAGDCRKNACDGRGNASEVDDDTDAPNDGNDCTIDACENGVPAYANQPAGSRCGVDLTCDAEGVCIGCTRAAQCGENTPCIIQVCRAEKCIQQALPDGGGDVPGQTPEDCKKLVCNGMGAIKTVNDPLDVKPDGNLCTTDGCNRGVPSYISNPPQDDGNSCTSDVCNPSTGMTDHGPTNQGQSCGACSVCDNGVCSSTCGGCDACVNGSCQDQCDSCETCNGGQCVSTCGGCQTCQNGQCVGGCAPCQQCNNGQCTGGCGPCQQCNNGQCVGGCDSAQCQSCNNGSCVNNCTGPCQVCSGGQCVSACSPCQSCSNGTCIDNCGPCQFCNGSICETTCLDCEFCSGGVCTYACDDCQFCNANGFCQFIQGCCLQTTSGPTQIPIPCDQL